MCEKEVNKAFRNELIERLYYMEADCALISDTIMRDGPQYTNIDLLRSHIKRYEEVIAKYVNAEGQ